MKPRIAFFSVGLLIFLFMAAGTAYSIPSFARQTNLSCNTCHIIFPRLNAFGRLFKLNGYTLTGISSIEAPGKNNPSLKITSFMPMSAMVQASYTSIKTAEPDTKASATEFPQQLSFFIAGEITPNLGTFIQITYDDQGAEFAWDNSDIRFATKAKLNSRDIIFGLTLNNNPTVQDVWNTTPAWGFPFISSAVAPTPSTSTLIDGPLAQQVAGLGAYAFYNSLAYAELTFYVSTPQGGAYPANSTSVNTIGGISPYWRFALQKTWGLQYLEVGTYGLYSELRPAGITGPTDNYTDFALDAQYERPAGSHGNLNVYATWIHESQELNATYAAFDSANLSNTVQTLRLTGSYSYQSRYALTLSYFSTTGSADPIFYAPESVTGSRAGKPNSHGLIFEAAMIPWQNTIFTVQYTLYTSFNGTGSNYDGFGRNASDNNTFYVGFWIAF
jgi:hypothetical protein